MSKSTLLISQVAIQDLETLWEQTSNYSSKAEADAVYKTVIQGIRKVADDFTLGQSLESVRDGYRSFSVETYVVYYRADRDGFLEIIRIL